MTPNCTSPIMNSMAPVPLSSVPSNAAVPSERLTISAVECQPGYPFSAMRVFQASARWVGSGISGKDSVIQ